MSTEHTARKKRSRRALLAALLAFLAVFVCLGSVYFATRGGAPGHADCTAGGQRCATVTATTIIAMITLTPEHPPATAISPSPAPSTPLVTPAASGTAPDTPVTTPTASGAAPAGTPTSAPGGAPAAMISGWLHTTGAGIFDNQNRPVTIHGVNHTGMEVGTGQPVTSQPGGYRPPTAKEVNDIATWGFNLVRLPLSWANLEPRSPVGGAHQYNEPYLAALDATIAQFGQRHVAVILVMHQWNWSPVFSGVSDNGVMQAGNGMPTWLYPTSGESMTQAKQDFFADKGQVQESFVAAWTVVARRYAGNSTVVGADLLNEPGQGADLTTEQFNLASLYLKAGQAIRAVNPRILLVYQDSDTLDGRALQSPLLLPNSIYSMHFYPRLGFSDPVNGQRWLTSYFLRSQRWNVPFWIGEFGKVGHASYATEMPPFIIYIEQNRMNWAFWAYSGTAAEIRQAATNPSERSLLSLLQAAITMQPPPAVR